MNATEQKSKLIEVKKFKHAVLSMVEDKPSIAVVEAITSYIPIEQFKEIFAEIAELVKKNRIKKLIFDKRNLTVFHQPSMEWYFVEWKEKMFAHGLTVHRKILPKDQIFRESVKIGREKIAKKFPAGKFKEMDIQYAETVDQAIAM